MNYNLSEEAEEELYNAYLWYENRRIGLGEEFLMCIEAGGYLIRRNPKSYSLKYKNVRSLIIKRFPYLILYFVDSNNINVIAVFHTSRSDKKWKRRIE